MALRGVFTKCSDYYDQIPPDTIRKIAYSGVFAFTATVVYHASKKTLTEPYNVTRPLVAAGVAMLASLIYSLTNPLFNKILGNNKITFLGEFMKGCVNVFLTSVAISYLTTSKVNLLALSLLISVPLNLLKGFLELIPYVAESWFDDKDFAELARSLFERCGVDVQPGSSGSIFVNAGSFPSLGFP